MLSAYSESGQAGIRSRVFKSPHDPFDQSAELSQGWDKGQREACCSFIERYLCGDLKLAVRRVGLGPRYYGAILEPWPNGREGKSLSQSLRVSHKPLRVKMAGDEPFVLPYYIEAVQAAEKVIPSAVRLQAFDDIEIDWTQPLFQFFSFRREGGVIGGKGEMSITTRFLAAANGQCRSCNVKGKSDAIDDSSHMGVDGEWPASVCFELEQLLAGLGVHIFDQQICWSPLPSINGLLNDWDLGSGPIDSGIGV